MNIINKFDNLKGLLTYGLYYNDGSSDFVEFRFENLRDFRLQISQKFLEGLEEDNGCDYIELIGIHIQDENNQIHINFEDREINGVCQNQIDSSLISENYIRQLKQISQQVNSARNILKDIQSGIEGEK